VVEGEGSLEELVSGPMEGGFKGFFSTRRVLVTGHTGFKGAWLAFWLAELGADVLGFALPPSTSPDLYSACGLDTRIQSIIGDIRDAGQVRGIVDTFRPEIVFHLAAQALVGLSYQDPLGTFSTNVLGTASVLGACAERAGVAAVVSVTSDKCYENQGLERGYVETDPMGGFDPYSASKGCAELVTSSYRRSFFEKAGIGLASARAGNVFGGGDFTEGRLVPDCLKAIRAGEPVRLRYPESIRPWQHVLEPLSGYLLLAKKLCEAPGSFAEGWNFGPSIQDSRPVRDLVACCYEAWGASSGSCWEQEPGDHPHEAALLRLDSAKARSGLGWTPSWGMEEAVRHTVEWHKLFLAGGDLASLMRRQIESHGAGHA
jgi:CDP-glucose 4,6-dehydratase